MNWIVPKEKTNVQIKLGDVNFHGSNVDIKFCGDCFEEQPFAKTEYGVTTTRIQLQPNPPQLVYDTPTL